MLACTHQQQSISSFHHNHNLKISTKHHRHEFVHESYPINFGSIPCHIFLLPTTTAEMEVVTVLLFTSSAWRKKINFQLIFDYNYALFAWVSSLFKAQGYSMLEITMSRYPWLPTKLSSIAYLLLSLKLL